MSRLTETEREQMVRGRLGGAEQIVQREQATGLDEAQLSRRVQAARTRLLSRALRQVGDTVKRARIRARVRRDLEALDQDLLRDIGIARCEIPRIAQEQAERLVPQRADPVPGPVRDDKPLFRARPHSARDIARYA